MNAWDIQIIGFIITFIVSVSTSAFIGGMRWQKLQDKVENMQEDLKEIKGMFTMTLKGDSK